MLSHGNGGWMGGHAGLALALAEAGFVVIAPEHPSDSGDVVQASASRWLPERPRDLSRAIDFVLDRWGRSAQRQSTRVDSTRVESTHAEPQRVDPIRVGAFGFSAGAYATLALAGARFDPLRLVAYCDAHPQEWACELGIAADVVDAMTAGTLDVADFERLADDRIAAAVVAGPALGFGFDPGSLADFDVPLQLWSGELDDAVPVATNTAYLRRHLPSGVESRIIDRAGHFAFLAPCRAELQRARPAIWQRVCVDAPGFDRAAFLRGFEASVVDFFEVSLPAVPAVGVRSLRTPAPHRDAPLDVTLWYPTGAGGTPELVGDNGVFEGAPAQRDAPVAAGRHPLVLLSHGGGGNARQFGWIANRFVEAGYLVAAPDHPGSTTGDASALGAVALWERPVDLSAVLTSLLADDAIGPSIDPDRVGALGFSAGGYTVLATAGARIDPVALASFCDDGDTGMSDCAFLARDGVDLHAIDLSPAALDLRDARIGAVVAVDPGVVGTITASSLAAIDVPVALVNLGAPGRIPNGVLAVGASRLIPGARYDTVEDAVHFSFLPECKPAGSMILEEEGEPDALCDDAGGRSRAELHERFAAMIVQAFEDGFDTAR